ncbi:hypothetical protein DTO164E3_498 [Paecilomyces variotii]|nr:hypothetical protein DTO032I3_1779 [Paecilomyces variotii]KAJ9207224.1 hypothetical protein DTO164E3_498 [Paecilomyces variotii]KAJ9281060.1 hypothetical protein DTO021D3_2114 [Paecilomyces variotii]KAJ9345433.1 hypothetical protein DTO027B6_1964 [Paecilomyces variotii]KAJ9386080.1 hypothetical protein DTO032I4_3811 [Paecilomyces variotii]
MIISHDLTVMAAGTIKLHFNCKIEIYISERIQQLPNSQLLSPKWQRRRPSTASRRLSGTLMMLPSELI